MKRRRTLLDEVRSTPDILDEGPDTVPGPQEP